MKQEEFNYKYRYYIEYGFKGLEFDIPKITKYLDSKFKDYVNRNNFKIFQIKIKFGQVRMYVEGISRCEKLKMESYVNNELSKYL